MSKDVDYKTDLASAAYMHERVTDSRGLLNDCAVALRNNDELQ